MRALLLSLALLALGAPAVESASRTVRVDDDVFRPASLSVSRGSTVTWRWVGRSPHNVVVRSGPVRFSSPLKRSGSYRRKLTRRGTYSIVCTLHSGMAMRLKVR